MPKEVLTDCDEHNTIATIEEHKRFPIFNFHKLTSYTRNYS